MYVCVCVCAYILVYMYPVQARSVCSNSSIEVTGPYELLVNGFWSSARTSGAPNCGVISPVLDCVFELKTEPRTLYPLGKHSTPELRPNPDSFLFSYFHLMWQGLAQSLRLAFNIFSSSEANYELGILHQPSF